MNEIKSWLNVSFLHQQVKKVILVTINEKKLYLWLLSRQLQLVIYTEIIRITILVLHLNTLCILSDGISWRLWTERTPESPFSNCKIGLQCPILPNHPSVSTEPVESAWLGQITDNSQSLPVHVPKMWQNWGIFVERTSCIKCFSKILLQGEHKLSPKKTLLLCGVLWCSESYFKVTVEGCLN